MKHSRNCTFQNKAAADRMAAAYRKQMGLGLDGRPRRYVRPKHTTQKQAENKQTK